MVIYFNRLGLNMTRSNIFDGQRECEGRCAFKEKDSVARGVIQRRKSIILAVSHPTAVFEPDGGSSHYLLFEEESFRARDDGVFVLDKGVCCVTNLLDLIIHSSICRCLKLKSSVRLNAVERGLTDKLRSTCFVILSNVVHYLEGGTTSQVKLDMITNALANWWQDV